MVWPLFGDWCWWQVSPNGNLVYSTHFQAGELSFIFNQLKGDGHVDWIERIGGRND